MVLSKMKIKKHQQMPVFFVKSYADNISAEVLFLSSREML